MKNDSFLRDIARAFTLPFTSVKGIVMFVTALALSMLPLGGLFCIGIAYCLYTNGSKNPGKWFGFGWKAFWAEILLCAPILFWYSLYILLHSYFYALPMWLNMIFFFFIIIKAVRAAFLYPAAVSSMAWGMPLRAAIKRSYAKRVMAGCLGRYMLSILICFIIDILLGKLTAFADGFLGYFLNCLVGTLMCFVTAGLFTASCRRSFGIAPPEKPMKSSHTPALQATALLLAFAMGVSSLSIPVSAENGKAAAPAQTQTQTQPKGDSATWLWNGLYKGVGNLTGTSPKNVERAVGLADMGTSLCPGVSTVKSFVQIPYYVTVGLTTDDKAAKDKAYYNAGFATLSALSFGLMKKYEAVKNVVNFDKFMKVWGWEQAGEAGYFAFADGDGFLTLEKVVDYTKTGFTKISEGVEKGIDLVDKGLDTITDSIMDKNPTGPLFDNPADGKTYLGIYRGKLDNDKVDADVIIADVHYDFSNNDIRLTIEPSQAQIKVLIEGVYTSSYEGVATIKATQKFDFGKAGETSKTMTVDERTGAPAEIDYVFDCIGNATIGYEYLGEGFENGGGKQSATDQIKATVNVKVKLTENEGYIATGSIQFKGAPEEYGAGMPLTFTLKGKDN